MELIDKSALVEEIERRIKELQDLFKEDEKKLDSFQKTAIHLCIDECKVVLNILNTLEVKDANETLRMEYEKGRADVIAKACEWLKSYRQDTPDGTGYIPGIINDETIEDFKQSMEE